MAGPNTHVIPHRSATTAAWSANPLRSVPSSTSCSASTSASKDAHVSASSAVSTSPSMRRPCWMLNVMNLTSARSLGPPRVEPGERRLLGHRALLEPQLEEHLECVADVAAGPQPEVLHHLVAVQVGPDRVELLLGPQLGDAV